MNLPNKLTLTRIILVPVFMIFVSLTGLDGIVDGTFNPTFYLLAGIVFAAASFTDYLDGHLARKWHMVTDFGKFADPLADKLLTTVAFIYMLRDGVCMKIAIHTDCQLVTCHRFLPAFPFLLKFLAIGVCHGQYLTIFAGKPVIITYFQSYNPLIITTGKPDDF